jgi:PAS domain S-box-containing protein
VFKVKPPHICDLFDSLIKIVKVIMKNNVSNLQVSESYALQSVSALFGAGNTFRAVKGGQLIRRPVSAAIKTEPLRSLFKLYPLQEIDFLITGFPDKTTRLSEYKTEAEAGISREFLQKSFFDQTSSMTWFVDESNRLIHANPALLHFLGLDKKDLNKNVTDIIPGFIRERFFKAHVNVRTSGTPFKKIWVQQLADGTKAYFLINIYPFTNTYNKNLLAGEAIDISYVFRMHDEMRKMNERLVNMSMVTTDPVWEYDMEAGCLFLNERLVDLLGRGRRKITDLTAWYSHIHPKDRISARQKMQDAVNEKRTGWENEFRLKSADNRYINLYEQGYIVYDENGEAVKMVASLRDITELKILEARLAREKVRQEKKLTGAILSAQEKERVRLGSELHDNVNQLLASCRLFLDLIKTKDNESTEMRNMVGTYIEAACTEIRSISHGLVASNFDQTGLCGRVQKILDDLASTNAFTINFKRDERVESLNNSKKITLLRILQEQVKNIIRHSKATTIGVQLTMADSGVQLCIKDNGVGFNPAACRPGIGLSNIYDRTRIYNGNIELNTSPGNGCELKVTMPARVK